MKVKFIGGPFHNTFKDVQLDDKGLPIPFFDFYPLQPLTKIQNDPTAKDESVRVDRYKLEEVWRDGRLSHYEYHYQGR